MIDVKNNCGELRLVESCKGGRRFFERHFPKTASLFTRVVVDVVDAEV